MNKNSEAVSQGMMSEGNQSSCTNTSCCPPVKSPVTRDTPKIGRNDPCICGSGRKFKKCCGKNI